MFSKILVGITGLALIGVGGFLYWDNHHCSSRSGCSKNGTCPTVILPSCLDAPCCLEQSAEITTSTSSENLTVMPREVIGQ